MTHWRVAVGVHMVTHVDCAGDSTKAIRPPNGIFTQTRDCYQCPFVYHEREYIYAEHDTWERWDLLCCMTVTVVLTAGVGFLFLGRPSLVYILMVAVSLDNPP